MAPQIDHPAALQPWEAAPLTPVAPASGSYSRRRHLLSKVNKPTALALTPSMPPRALSVAIGADVVAKQLEVPLDQRFALRLSRNWFAIDDAIAGLKNDHEGFGTLGIGHYPRQRSRCATTTPDRNALTEAAFTCSGGVTQSGGSQLRFCDAIGLRRRSRQVRKVPAAKRSRHGKAASTKRA